MARSGGVVLFISMSKAKKNFTVLVFGTFDLLHAGHRSFLRQAKRFGNRLIVAVGRDRVVARLKRRVPQHSERKRLSGVASLPYVHRAVLASSNPLHRYRFIKRLQPNIIALGYDQRHFTKNLHRELKAHGINCRIIRLKPYKPQHFKSSLIRQRLATKRKA